VPGDVGVIVDLGEVATGGNLLVEHGKSQLKPTTPFNQDTLDGVWLTANMLDQFLAQTKNYQSFSCPVINLD